MMTIQAIPTLNLALAFIPVIAVIALLYRWSLEANNAIYAVVRMLVQLLLVGYVLTAIFEAESAWVVMLVLLVMVISASWIALGAVKAHRLKLYRYALSGIVLGGGLTLILVTQSVIPLAGMIFANSMNCISLATERLYAEIDRGVSYQKARAIAFQAAFIPVVNSLFAVGLVSLPGMMTGQILSGVSPVVAAHYQIVVMCMLFGSTGLSTACFLAFAKPIIIQTEA
jgi:putative ABC transport system permease protein